MDVWQIAFFVVLTLSVLLLIATVIYYRFWRKYTRERFALRAFLLISTLSTTLIFLIFGTRSTFSSVFKFVAAISGVRIPEYEPTFSDKALCTIIIAALIYLAITLHRNWPGEISVRENMAQKDGIKPNLFDGTLAALADYVGKAPLEKFSSESSRRQQSDFVLSPIETKAWHQWVARILQLTSNQIHVDEINDWYPEHRLFIGHYGPTGLPRAVLCLSSRPTSSELEDVLKFLRSQEITPTHITIAIDGYGQREITTLSGPITVETRYKNELLDSLVDFSSYTSDIKYRYEVAKISEGYSKKIPDVYVESSGHTKCGDAQVSIPSVENFVLSWLTETGLKHLAVLGEYGQGKSVLALKLAYRLLSERAFRVPILIPLGGRSPLT